MGTEITLTIGGLDLTYSKNFIGIDHGSLFQEKDRQRYHSNQIDYNYFAEIDEEPTNMEMAFVRPLKQVVSRLELLGYTLDFIEKEYNNYLPEWNKQKQYLYEELEKNSNPPQEIIDFTGFFNFVTSYNLKDLDDNYQSDNKNDIRGRFNNLSVIETLPENEMNNAYSELSYFGNLINVLHPYSVLRLLAENPNNLEQDLVWQYGPLVEAGWADNKEFKVNAKKNEVFLIATEGSSDANILKHAFQNIYPNIFDFFQFVDPETTFPHTGATNLFKFAQGLINIECQNKVLFLFDNDTEGRYSLDNFHKIQKNLNNIRAIFLPELEEFNNFPTFGPEGDSYANINGKAAAIECYLDLNFEQTKPPKVIWTNYKEKTKEYHGVLDFKEIYMKKFLEQEKQNLIDGTYHIEKINCLLNTIISECKKISLEILCSTY